MRYFIEEDELKFYKEPNSFNKYSDKNILKYAVGANLYIKLKFWCTNFSISHIKKYELIIKR